MSVQSSRIIWGKTKKGEVSDSPVTVYDPDYTIYTYDNECIYQDKLYKCIVAETGGANFTASEWKEIKGVAPFSTTKSYKVNAYCIYQRYLYKCIQAVTYTSYDPVVKYPDQYPAYWELTLQPVNVAYSPRDHKDVYYDDGRNSVKWHRMMYYLPPELEGDENLAVTIYDDVGNYRYKKDDLCIGYSINNVIGLYKCTADLPIHEPWNLAHWERQDTPVFEVGTTYQKGDEVIHNFSEIVSEIVTEFNPNVKYLSGQYVLDVINKHRDNYSGLFDFDYELRISSGEEIIGCYILNQDIPEGSTYFDHSWGTLTNYRQYDSGVAPTTIGEYFIRSVDGAWTLSKVESGTGGQPFEYVDVEELHSYKQGWYLFRSFEDQIATHFNRDKWIIVTQTYDILYDELYGVIWQKLGMPGGAGHPHFFPVAIEGFKTGGVTHRTKVRVNSFFPYLGDNILETGPIIEFTENNPSPALNGGFTKIFSNKQFVYGILDTVGDGFFGINTHEWGSVYCFDHIGLLGRNGEWKILQLDYPVHSRIGIIPTSYGFMYVEGRAYDSSSPLPLHKVVLNAANDDILSDTILIQDIKQLPYYHNILNRDNLYNGFIKYANQGEVSEYAYPPTGAIMNYEKDKIIDEDGNTLDTGMLYYYSFAAYNIAAAGKPQRYLFTRKIVPEIGDLDVITTTNRIDGNPPTDILAACSYWGCSWSYNSEYHYGIVSDIREYRGFYCPYQQYIDFSNKEGTIFYHFEFYHGEYITAGNVSKEFNACAMHKTSVTGTEEEFMIYCETIESGSLIGFSYPEALSVYLYNYDDQFAYFCGNGIWMVDLLSGAITKTHNDSGQNDPNIHLVIPYYGGNGCEVMGATLNTLTLNLAYESGGGIVDIENGNINVSLSHTDKPNIPRVAYCGSETCAPSISHSLFVSDRIELRNPDEHRSSNFTLCIYIPNFKQLPNNTGAFFWLSHDENVVGFPMYGGPTNDEGGFEGW